MFKGKRKCGITGNKYLKVSFSSTDFEGLRGLFVLGCIEENVLFAMAVSTYIQPTFCHLFSVLLPGGCVL